MRYRRSDSRLFVAVVVAVIVVAVVAVVGAANVVAVAALVPVVALLSATVVAFVEIAWIDSRHSSCKRLDADIF